MEELDAIAVDVLDAHRGDDLAQLAKNDVPCLLFDLRYIQPQKADRGVLHDLGVRPDCHGENAGDVDANILDRQRILQRDLNLNRFQTQEGMVLNQRPDKSRASVDTPGGVSTPNLAKDNEHAVTRTAFVAADEQHKKAERHDRHKDHHEDQPNVFHAGWGLGKKNGGVHGSYS